MKASVPHNSSIGKTSSIRIQRKISAAQVIERQSDERLGRIIRVLMNYSTTVISGTKLAQEIGTTRSEVWRLVQQLRSFGVEIAGHPSSGYQLTAVPDLLLPELLQPLLRGTIFSEHIHHYYRAGSTNTIAMEAAAAGASEGTVFLAEQQTAGRGRGNNQWYSAESAGIYCSFIVRPPLPPSEVLVLSLAAGLAVRAAVREIDSKAIIDLKWPNDLLIDDHKFCGILTEMNAEATRVRHIVIGIGINVNQVEFPAELRQTATSLRISTGTKWSRVDLCAALLKSLDREYKNLISNPIAHDDILKRFEEHSSVLRGKMVRVEENGGFDGITEGLDPRGFLLVRSNSGLRIVYSGTVRLATSN